jgi:hypothetical protein
MPRTRTISPRIRSSTAVLRRALTVATVGALAAWSGLVGSVIRTYHSTARVLRAVPSGDEWSNADQRKESQSLKDRLATLLYHKSVSKRTKVIVCGTSALSNGILASHR